MRPPLFGTLRANLRQLVMAGIALSILGISVLGGMSYSYLLQLDDALGLAEVVDDLSSDILEIRRYEKNYLLYVMEEDYTENLAYIERALGVTNVILPPDGTGMLGTDEQGRHAIVALRQQLHGYRATITRLEQLRRQGDNRQADSLLNDLREEGKRLVEGARQIAAYQRSRILGMVSKLKQQLLISILGFLAVAVFFSWLVGRRLLGAFTLIENATRGIVQGDFKPLPLPDSRDESRSVVKALNHMIEELENRQNQLVQEKKLASLGVLTSGIAHQLNNPLNNISTSCQILQEDIGSGDAELHARMLRNIHQEVLRSRDIVKGLLEFAREKDFSLVPQRLADVVERAVSLVSSEVPAGVTLSASVPPDMVVPLDAQHMQEALINLLINAIQAIPAPPGTITVSATRVPGRDMVALRVEDTGTGIPPEHLGRIFDPFFTLKAVGKGTGLGLSIVFGVVKKHGGRVTVESEPGKGTAFIIHLHDNDAAGRGMHT